MASLYFILSLFVAGSLAATFNDCGGSSARLKSVTLSPSPLLLKTGKKIDFSYDIEVLKPFPQAIDVVLTLKRKILWGYVGGVCTILDKAIPDDAGVKGSICQQHLTCDMLQKLQDQANQATKYPCPMPVGTYTKKLSVTLPTFDAGTLGSVLGGGTYQIEIEMKRGSELLACAKISDLTVEL
ncbi:uncharacterized protein [Clytia hemisphaerica]|uniref:MD-2-related lipid-recognition domain-containing protein n=1 Tax=Clytia hemisphaerica TaxID=252671 RepID=A0A7M5V3T7_9CNID|eukprot:TCONS_00013285-protein